MISLQHILTRAYDAKIAWNMEATDIRMTKRNNVIHMNVKAQATHISSLTVDASDALRIDPRRLCQPKLFVVPLSTFCVLIAMLPGDPPRHWFGFIKGCQSTSSSSILSYNSISGRYQKDRLPIFFSLTTMSSEIKASNNSCGCSELTRRRRLIVLTIWCGYI